MHLVFRTLSSKSGGFTNTQSTWSAQLIVVDPVGLQLTLPMTENSKAEAIGNYADFVFNYAYERLHQLYFETTYIWNYKRLKAVCLSLVKFFCIYLIFYFMQFS